MPSQPRFTLNISLDYLQSIRLAQALLEAGGQLHFDQQEQIKFARLLEVFSVAPAFGPHDYPVLPGISIDHALPATTVGRITKPLIFPQAMAVFLHDRWPEARHHRVSFAGLMTEKRIVAMNRWLASYDCRVSPIAPPGLRRRFMNKINTRLDRDSTEVVKKSDAVFWSSNKGRHFPVKAWDSDYFDLLLHSQFVLCPTGDYVWSYRFLEAVLCGAIPVVETDCPLFDGFRFFRMTDALQGALWSAEDAAFNFALACERVFVPATDLLAEMQFLLAGGSYENVVSTVD